MSDDKPNEHAVSAAELEAIFKEAVREDREELEALRKGPLVHREDQMPQPLSDEREPTP